MKLKGFSPCGLWFAGVHVVFALVFPFCLTKGRLEGGGIEDLLAALPSSPTDEALKSMK